MQPICIVVPVGRSDERKSDLLNALPMTVTAELSRGINVLHLRRIEIGTNENQWLRIFFFLFLSDISFARFIFFALDDPFAG